MLTFFRVRAVRLLPSSPTSTQLPFFAFLFTLPFFPYCTLPAFDRGKGVNEPLLLSHFIHSSEQFSFFDKLVTHLLHGFFLGGLSPSFLLVCPQVPFKLSRFLLSRGTSYSSPVSPLKASHLVFSHRAYFLSLRGFGPFYRTSHAIPLEFSHLGNAAGFFSHLVLIIISAASARTLFLENAAELGLSSSDWLVSALCDPSFSPFLD